MDNIQAEYLQAYTTRTCLHCSSLETVINHEFHNCETKSQLLERNCDGGVSYATKMRRHHSITNKDCMNMEIHKNILGMNTEMHW